MRKFLTLLVFLVSAIAFLSSPRGVGAQGTFNCSWTTSCNSTILNNCQQGYMPDSNYCKQFSTVLTCPSGPVPCITNPSNPTPSGSPAPITCGGGTSIDTAIGCIPFDNINALAGFFLRWGIGIGGGIAFLFIVYAGFLVLTSSGNPDRMKAGQELLTSAIGGLLLLIFSVFILKLIGVDILRLPI